MIYIFPECKNVSGKWYSKSIRAAGIIDQLYHNHNNSGCIFSYDIQNIKRMTLCKWNGNKGNSYEQRDKGY